MKKTKKETITISSDEIPKLIEAVQNASLSEKHKEIILTLINQMVEIKQTAKEKAASLARIKRMLGKATEKMDKKTEEATEHPKEKKNHGRNSVDDYRFAKVVDHPHEFQAGDTCPLCAHGTLQHGKPRKIIRLIGQAPVIVSMSTKIYGALNKIFEGMKKGN
ncbi:MAG: hypothetical protein HQK54_09790, partial [Oligoflexales bacterium]|nr:hypothetical protein [Oligoflexales bacterium]